MSARWWLGRLDGPVGWDAATRGDCGDAVRVMLNAGTTSRVENANLDAYASELSGRARAAGDVIERRRGAHRERLVAFGRVGLARVTSSLQSALD